MRVTDPAESRGAEFKCVLLSCTFTGAVVPEDTLIVTFPVDVLLSEPGSVTNLVRVSGGGAPGASVSTPTTISKSLLLLGFAGQREHGAVERAGGCASGHHDVGRVQHGQHDGVRLPAIPKEW